MNREEAIKYLIKPVSTSTSDGEEKQKEFEAYKMAIEALEKLPCEDAISRSEAIKVASGYCHWANIPDELAKLPSVAPQQEAEWIPVSVAEPKENEYVLCTVKNTEHPIIIAKYDDKPWWKHIEAWMPLPEPYKGVEE